MRGGRPIFALGWLAFILVGAAYTKIDEWLSDPRIAEADKGLPFVQDPFYQGTLWGTSERVESPSFDHWLGTDVLGRDVFARLLSGSSHTVWVVFGALFVGVMIGGFIGLFGTLIDGYGDAALRWVADLIDSFPPLIFLIALVPLAGSVSARMFVFVVGLLLVPSYVRAARWASTGSDDQRVSTDGFGELVRRAMPVLLALSVANAATVVLLDATLSFLGLGPSAPTPSWGNEINAARSEIGRTILPTAFPAAFIVLTMFALHRIADFLQSRVVFADAPSTTF